MPRQARGNNDAKLTMNTRQDQTLAETMETALRKKTIIQAGGRIVITDAQLQEGREVEVIILQRPEAPAKRAAIEILSEIEGKRLFKTAAQVEGYLRKERDAWE